MMSYTCIIIDDHIKVANRLKTLVTDFTDLEVLWTETDPLKAIEKVCKLQPDIVFLDVEMRPSGFEVIKEIRKRKVNPTLIMVTGHDQYAIRAINESAAFGYLLKPVDIDELQETLRRYEEKMKTNSTESDTGLPLNPREKEVLVLLAQGLTSKAIAEKLSISKSTVDSHWQNILAKTGAKNTAELITLTRK